MRIKGYKLIGYSDLHPPYKEIISVPLKGAKFLTGMKLIAAHLADNITAPSPLWISLKEKGFVLKYGEDIVEPIYYGTGLPSLIEDQQHQLNVYHSYKYK